MFKSLTQLYNNRLGKGGPGSGCHGDNCGRKGGPKTDFGTATEGRLAHPAERKLSTNEAFKYYVKIKDADFGYNIVAAALNKKVGMAEGMAKAYRERAGKMPEGKAKDKLLAQAYRLKVQAAEYASARDSNLGRPAHKVQKQDELSEQEILDLLESGEFDEIIRQEILQDLERETKE